MRHDGSAVVFNKQRSNSSSGSNTKKESDEWRPLVIENADGSFVVVKLREQMPEDTVGG